MRLAACPEICKKLQMMSAPHIIACIFAYAIFCFVALSIFVMGGQMAQKENASPEE